MKKKRYQYIVFLAVILLSMALLAGCRKEADSSTSVDNPAAGESPAAAGTENPSTDAPAALAPGETAAPSPGAEGDGGKEGSSTTELPIYSLNEESLECEDTIAFIPKDEKITSAVIVNAVVDSFRDHGVEIGIDSITEENSSVIVSFESDKAPLNTGSTVESTILDCISQSLVDNLEDCRNVIFRVNGKAYESGHNLFGLDEAYLTK